MLSEVDRAHVHANQRTPRSSQQLLPSSPLPLAIPTSAAAVLLSVHGMVIAHFRRHSQGTPTSTAPALNCSRSPLPPLAIDGTHDSARTTHASSRAPTNILHPQHQYTRQQADPHALHNATRYIQRANTGRSYLAGRSLALCPSLPSNRNATLPRQDQRGREEPSLGTRPPPPPPSKTGARPGLSSALPSHRHGEPRRVATCKHSQPASASGRKA